MDGEALSPRPIARVALPGVNKEDVKVEVHDTHLTISARRNAETETRKEVVYHRDSHGGFFRTILLPDGVDVNHIQASFNDGVLEVHVLEARKGIAARKRRDGHDAAARRQPTWRPPMVEIRTILCPVDFSDHSRYALENAVSLAAWYGASVSILHVHQIGIPAPVVDPLVPPMAAEAILVSDDDRESVERRLHEFITAARTDHVKIESSVEDSTDVVAAILSRANAIGADLIALGTNGRTSPQRGTLGPVAEGVLQGAARPVLCLGSRAADRLHRGPVSFRRIICPVDFSENSARALACAASFARDANAWLTVVHVVELVSEIAALAPDFDEHREVRLEPARRSLRKLVVDTVPPSIVPEELLQMGSPHHEIVHLAEEQQAGLLVMGLHGKRGDGASKLGQTSRAAVPRAPCPVLIVP